MARNLLSSGESTSNGSQTSMNQGSAFMLVRLSHIALGGLLAFWVAGCDSKPAVVIENPPARSQTEVDVQTPVVQPPDSRPQVDVQVGGGKGVDVNVGAPPSTPPER
jgi:hypothetical protein